MLERRMPRKMMYATRATARSCIIKDMKSSFSAFAEIAVAQESGTKCLRIDGIETPFFPWS
jgi:hypothetical protein